MIVGIHERHPFEFKVPAPTYETMTSREALAGIASNANHHVRTKQSKTVIERLSYIGPGENVWNAKRLPEHLKLNVPRTQLSHIYKSLTLKTLIHSHRKRRWRYAYVPLG